jgi:predicted Zn-dependent peptidase
VPREHHLTTLENGVRVATEAMPGLRSVALGVFVGVGSRDESASTSGVSHFIEHLLFRGSDRHDALTIAKVFDRFGSELNASTSREVTELYARVIDTQLPTAFGVMAGMVRAPLWAELDSERDVVVEEIAMYEDTPDDLIHDLVGEAVFPDDPLGRPIIGTAEVLDTLDAAAVAAHHAAYYTAPNVVVAAAGAVEHGVLVELVRSELSSLAPVQRPDLVDLERRAPTPRTFLERDTEQYHVCLSALGISRHDERRFAAGVLDQLLGGGASSRLFQEVRERRGMAYAVYSFGAHYRDVGQVGVYLGTRSENLEECLAVVRAEIDAVAAGRFADDEVERAKDAIKGRVVLSMESTSSRMSRVGRSALLGLALLDEAEVTRRVDAVTEADVATLAAELFAPGLLAVAAIGPDRAVFERAADALAVSAP